MDSEGQKFGRGPRELSGAVDLVSRYNLLVHHDFFCKKHLPMAILDTHYLHTVVGGTEIRKGGMLLGQLIQNTWHYKETNVRLQPFDLDVLTDAFELRDTSPVDLSENEKGIPTIFGKSKDEAKNKEKVKEKKHKKRKDRDKDKDKENKKLKHRHKDKDKETKKDISRHHDSLKKAP